MIPRRLKIALLLLSGMVLFMGLYALRLKHEVDVNQRQAADARPLTPLLAGSSQNVVLYIANDDDGRLHRKDLALPLPTEPNARARQVLRALLAQYSDRDSRHPLDSGSEVTAVFVVNGSLAVVNFNSATVHGHRSGILVEELTLASVAQTLAANLPSITEVKFMIDGRQQETLAGHADTLDVFDVAQSAHYLAGAQ